jgi:ADP-ribose pyrophosphatase YjhB (NUDIX family)
MAEHKNPVPTVDIIIEMTDDTGREGVVLIERKNPPYGWALPGGFVNYGESLEEAAIREAKEETSLDIEIVRQFHTYSDPQRDPRGHTLATVFIARAAGVPTAGDDAKTIGVFASEEVRFPLAFDHSKILEDYYASKRKPAMANDQEKPLKELRSVWGQPEADIIKALLESHGIVSVFRGQIVHSIYPISVNGLGETKIFVLEEDYEAARSILDELPKFGAAEESEKDEEEL